MPNMEDIIIAINHLAEFKENLEGYIDEGLVRGDIMPTNKFIDETHISVDIALQVLIKRVEHHIIEQKLGVENIVPNEFLGGGS